MQLSKHMVIVAGEESGDQHAAHFVRALKKTYPELRCTGIGGQHMHDAGVTLLADLARYGVTGASEVLTHARVIYQAFRAIKAHLTHSPPDLLVLVDYPGFNLRLARFAKEKLKLRIVFYISPQIWAWKAGRMAIIRRYVDKMAVILPFERPLYQAAGVPVAFVGHPLVARVDPHQPRAQLKAALQLPLDKTILALLPGSRSHEIKRHMPILREVVQRLVPQYPQLHIVIPVARSLSIASVQTYFKQTDLPVSFIAEQAMETMYCSDIVLVASGTASLECALLKKPMGILYKTSLLTFAIAAHYMRVKYLGLCNLLQQQMIVPEFLQYDCNPDTLTAFVSAYMNNPTQYQPMITRLTQLTESLSEQKADISIEALLLAELTRADPYKKLEHHATSPH